MDDVRILTLDQRDEWDREHQSRGLPGHSWHFAAALRLSHVEVEPKLAVVRSADAGSMLMVFIERQWGACRDIATVAGLSGATLRGDARKLLDCWNRFAIEQGWMSGYLQLSIEFAKDSIELRDECVDRLPTFLLDPQAWRLEATAVTIRQKISKASHAGAIALVRPQISGKELHELYSTTMQRFGMAPAFTPETLQAWANSPGSMVVAASVAGRFEAMLLVHVSSKDAEAHLVGSTRAGRALTALVYCRAIEVLREMGVTRFNLGPGGAPGEGLYAFKSWLRASPSPTYALHQVYDRAEFERLCLAAGVKGDETRFPPYRYP
jgi:hypothetical protein